MDYALCTGEHCPLAKQCKRTDWFEPPQIAWWVKPQYDEQTNSCEFYK